MASHRFEIDTTAGPARGSVIGGRGILLVRVRLFDGILDDASGEPAGDEDIYTDLRPNEARRLAFKLLKCAEQAEQITAHAGWWQQ